MSYSGEDVAQASLTFSGLSVHGSHKFLTVSWHSRLVSSTVFPAVAERQWQENELTLIPEHWTCDYLMGECSQIGRDAGRVLPSVHIFLFDRVTSNPLMEGSSINA